jgi:hypothetical protein
MSDLAYRFWLITATASALSCAALLVMAAI